MTIDFAESGLRVSDSNQTLTSIHSNQLQFWGFRKLKGLTGEFHLDAADYRPVLRKLISYFDNEKLQYALSPACKLEVEKLQSGLAETSRLREVGRSIKAGQINAEDFVAFSDGLQRQVKRRLKEHQLRAAFHSYTTQNPKKRLRCGCWKHLWAS